MTARKKKPYSPKKGPRKAVNVKTTKSRVSIPKDATTPAILKALNNWARMNAAYGKTIGMWRILTALRGPDDGNHEAKREHTNRIRGLVPNLAMVGGGTTNPIYSTQSERGRLIANWGHFMNHIQLADDAVRLLYPEKKP